MSSTPDYTVSEQPLCSVMMDGTVQVSDDFIVILANEEGNVSIFYNTDAMTMGMAVKMTSHEYIKLLKELRKEDQSEIVGVLGDEFALSSLLDEEDACEVSK